MKPDDLVKTRRGGKGAAARSFSGSRSCRARTGRKQSRAGRPEPPEQPDRRGPGETGPQQLPLCRGAAELFALPALGTGQLSPAATPGLAPHRSIKKQRTDPKAQPVGPREPGPFLQPGRQANKAGSPTSSPPVPEAPVLQAKVRKRKEET